MSEYFTIKQKVDLLKGSEILADQVRDNNGIVVFDKHHKLNTDNIATLKELKIIEITIQQAIEAKNIKTDTSKQKSYDFIGIDKKEVYSDEEDCLIVDSKKAAKIHSGIIDFTTKILETISFDFEKVESNVNSLLENIELNQSAMISLVHLKDVDKYTFMHSVNVSILSMLLAKNLSLDKEDIHLLGVGAILHDIGKMKIDQNVLNKPGKLNDIEFNEIKNHTKKGYDLLKSRGIDEKIALVALTHHEKINGKGYPMGLSGDKLPLISKISAVVDIYDALTADRIYKKSMHPFEALEIINNESDISLDGKLIKSFKEILGVYPISSKVILANGSLARVIKQNKNEPSKPIVEIISDRYGNIPKKSTIINTSTSTEFFIQSIFKK